MLNLVRTMGATLDPRLHVLPSNHLKYLQVGSSFYKQNQIRVIHKANKTRKPTKPKNKKGKKKMKTYYYSPHHSSCIHKTLSQNCSRLEQFIANNCQQSMNGDWNSSNNLKKTCLNFTEGNGFGVF